VTEVSSVPVHGDNDLAAAVLNTGEEYITVAKLCNELAAPTSDSVILPATVTEVSELVNGDDLATAILTTGGADVKLTDDFTALRTGSVVPCAAVTVVSTELADVADKLAPAVLSTLATDDDKVTDDFTASKTDTLLAAVTEAMTEL